MNTAEGSSLIFTPAKLSRVVDSATASPCSALDTVAPLKMRVATQCQNNTGLRILKHTLRKREREWRTSDLDFILSCIYNNNKSLIIVTLQQCHFPSGINKISLN